MCITWFILKGSKLMWWLAHLPCNKNGLGLEFVCLGFLDISFSSQSKNVHMSLIGDPRLWCELVSEWRMCSEMCTVNLSRLNSCLQAQEPLWPWLGISCGEQNEWMDIFKINHGQYKATSVIVVNIANKLFLLPLDGWNLDFYLMLLLLLCIMKEKYKWPQRQ